MILALIVSVLLAMMVLMAGFYFLHFVREKNLGKTHIIIGNAVVVFSLLVIICAFICGSVCCVMGCCKKGKSCHKTEQCESRCDSQSECGSNKGSCSTNASSCSSKSMGHCSSKSASCSKSCDKEMIMIEKEISDEGDGTKKIEIEVTK